MRIELTRRQAETLLEWLGHSEMRDEAGGAFFGDDEHESLKDIRAKLEQKLKATQE
jgi:hypothetical protein